MPSQDTVARLEEAAAGEKASPPTGPSWPDNTSVSLGARGRWGEPTCRW